MTTQPMKTIILDLLRQSQQASAAFVQTLDETERTTIGTPEHWSAKDHLAHMTYCLHQNLILKVNAILRQQEVSPREESVDRMNARVFVENQLRPWSEIHASFEQVYSDLIQLARQLSESDLMDSHRFTAVTGGVPLYTAFLGNGYEHLQEHFVQYYCDRNDLSRAIPLREECANRVLQTDVPAWVKGWFLYNLACFYAQQNQLDQAAAHLREAFAFAPVLEEQSKSDPDLAALYTQTG